MLFDEHHFPFGLRYRSPRELFDPRTTPCPEPVEGSGQPGAHRTILELDRETAQAGRIKFPSRVTLLPIVGALLCSIVRRVPSSIFTRTL